MHPQHTLSDTRNQEDEAEEQLADLVEEGFDGVCCDAAIPPLHEPNYRGIDAIPVAMVNLPEWASPTRKRTLSRKDQGAILQPVRLNPDPFQDEFP